MDNLTSLEGLRARKIARMVQENLAKRYLEEFLIQKVTIFLACRLKGGGFGPAYPAEQDAFLAMTQEFIPKYERFIKKFLGSLVKETVENIKKPKKSMKRHRTLWIALKDFDVDKWLFDINTARTTLDAKNPYYLTPAAAKAGQAGIDSTGFGMYFNVADPRALKYMATHSKNSAWKITETLHLELRAELAAGMAFGMSIPELTDRIERFWDEISAARAELIARTEVLKASNFGFWQGMVQSGVVEGKQWLATADRQTCPHCAYMDGRTMPLDKPFFKLGDTLTPPMIDPEWGNWVDADGNMVDSIGEAAQAPEMKFDYEEVTHPPLHPDCRCTLLAILKESSTHWAPQRTLAAAKSWAKAHLATKLAGLERVNIEWLNSVMKTVYTYEQRTGKGLPIDHILFGDVTGNAYAQYNKTTRVIHFKKRYKDMAARMQLDNEIWAKRFGGNVPFHSTSTVEGTIWHEIGHALDHAANYKYADALTGLPMDEKMKLLKVSGYAGSDFSVTKVGPVKKETWAEILAAYAENSDRVKFIPDKVKLLCQEALGGIH